MKKTTRLYRKNAQPKFVSWKPIHTGPSGGTEQAYERRPPTAPTQQAGHKKQRRGDGPSTLSFVQEDTTNTQEGVEPVPLTTEEANSLNALNEMVMDPNTERNVGDISMARVFKLMAQADAQ